MKKELMKIQEAADYIGVHKKTLDNWIRAKRKITMFRDPITGFRYFDKKDLDIYMQSMKTNNS